MHLGMSGSFEIDVTRLDPEDARHDHVVFSMSSGAVVTFNDPRRFGFMDLLDAEALPTHPVLSTLGPEPLSPEFTAAALARACKGKKTPLKVALLDQRVVAGLGNIYAAEALHLARPVARAAGVDHRDLVRRAAGVGPPAGRGDQAGADRSGRAADTARSIGRRGSASTIAKGSRAGGGDAAARSRARRRPAARRSSARLPALVSRPSGSWHKSVARRPDRKARRARISGTSEGGATQPAGMPRRGVMSRATGTGT